MKPTYEVQLLSMSGFSYFDFGKKKSAQLFTVERRFSVSEASLVYCSVLYSAGGSATIRLCPWSNWYMDFYIVAVIVPRPIIPADLMAQAALSGSSSAIHLVLVDDLQDIVVDILFINQRDVFGRAIVTA